MTQRFIDASVFIYAYLKPKKTLKPELLELKKNAQSIVKRINEGEHTATNLIHISEETCVMSLPQVNC